MKRQIIKTKPVQPYRVARMIFAIVLVIIVAAVAFELWTRAHATHASAVLYVRAVQDSQSASRNPPSPVVLR